MVTTTVTTFAHRFAAWSRRAAPGRADRPRLVARERVLLDEAGTVPGAGAVVTNHALHLRVDPAVGLGWQRIPWPDVDGVGEVRRPDGGRTLLVRVGRTTHTAALGRRSRLPALAAELTASATVLRRRAVLSDGSPVVFVAQRDPISGRISWRLDLPPGADGWDATRL